MPDRRKPAPPVDQALVASVRTLLDRRDARSLPAASARTGPKVTARDDGGTELLIYDEISHWGISASDVANSLADARGDLHVRVNSPGGDVFDGVAIYNMLRDYPGQVTVTVDGLAASAASFIAMAADRLVMNRASQFMIHDASGFCYGNAADMAEMTTLLDRISDTIASIYEARTGIGNWRAAMKSETWYSADEAVAAGLADEVQGDAAPAENGFDLSIFNYSGRADAPAPVINQPPANPVGEELPAGPVFQFDPDAFRRAFEEASAR